MRTGSPACVACVSDPQPAAVAPAGGDMKKQGGLGSISLCRRGYFATAPWRFDVVYIMLVLSPSHHEPTSRTRTAGA